MTDTRSDHWENYWAGAGGGAPAQAVSGARPGDHFGAVWEGYFKTHLPSAPQSTLVADLACGTGVVTEHALTATRSLGGDCGLRFVGVDYAEGAARHIAGMRSGGECVLGVVADAARLPLPDRCAHLVVSQFGVEYAGAGAFREAARILAPGGALQIIAHYRGGAIDRECAENADTIGEILGSGLLSAFRKLAQAADPAAEKQLQRALGEVAALGEKRRGAAATAGRLAADIAHMAARRRAFAPADLVAWADGMRRELEQYRARMMSMTSASLDRRAAGEALEQIRAEGALAADPEAMSIVEGDPPAAWRLQAARP